MTSAAEDWSIRSVVWIFSVAIVFLGLSAAVAGAWLEKVGPRLVVASACLWGVGFIVGGVGVHLQLWLLYLGYGALGGIGLGMGYVSPVSTLTLVPRPAGHGDRDGDHDNRCAAQGVPDQDFLPEAPQFLGPAGAVSLITEQGRRFTQMGGR